MSKQKLCQNWKIQIDMFQTLRTFHRNNDNRLAPKSWHVTFFIISWEKDSYSNYMTTTFQCVLLMTGLIALSTQMHICHSLVRLCWWEEFQQHLTFQAFVPWQSQKTQCYINPIQFSFIRPLCQNMYIKIMDIKNKAHVRTMWKYEYKLTHASNPYH